MVTNNRLGVPLLRELAECAKCKLSVDGCAVRPVLGWGPSDATLIVIGEAPGIHERDQGRPFVGASGKLLWDVLRGFGVPSLAPYRTNALLCLGTVAPTVKDVAACAPRLEAELNALSHKRVILALGGMAATALRGKKSAITPLNGRWEWSEKWGAHLVYAYHPAAVLRNPSYYSDFVAAVETAVRLDRGEVVARPSAPIEWWEAQGPESALAMLLEIEATSAETGVLVCDLETTGLDPLADAILSVGFSADGQRSYIFPSPTLLHERVRQELRELFVYRSFVGHNAKFDAKFLRAQLAMPARIAGDSMLLHYCLDERSGGEGSFHDLKTLARRYCNAPDYAAGIDTSDTTAIPPAQLYEYQAYDCAYTWRLYQELRRRAAGEPASRMGWPTPIETHDRFLVRAANALVEVELRGIRVDTERLEQLQSEYTKLIETAKETARRAVDAPPGFNPNSFPQVSRALYSAPPEGLGYPFQRSTAEYALNALQRYDLERGRAPHPFLGAVLEYRSLLHTKSTYLDGTAARLRRGRRDGRVRSTFLLHGTTSGRLSSRDPNLQNVPKDSVIKELFIPSEGRVLVEADYRRLEVGVLAWYADDEVLARDFGAEDFHWTVAQRVFPHILGEMEGASLERLEAICEKHAMFSDFAQRQARPTERTESVVELYGWMKARIRRGAKYVTFGIQYGEGPTALSRPGNEMGMEYDDAVRYIAEWKATYRRAASYLEYQARLAREVGWVESASGRRRRFNYPAALAAHISNEAMNHPIQALASDICLLALIELNQLLPALGLGDVLLSVHDSILAEIETPRLAEGKDVMRRVMSGVLKSDLLVFDVDIGSGPTWAQCA